MIDPSILLDSKPVNIETPLDAATQAQSLKNLGNTAQLQQGQIAAQPAQLQAQDLQNQQTQQQLDRTKALNAAYAGALTPGANGGPATLDTDRLTNALATGGHGAAIPDVMKGVIESQKAATDLGDAKTKLATDQADYIGGIGATVAQANNDPRLLLSLAQHGLAVKALDPTVVNPIVAEVTQSLQQDPSGAQATALTKQLTDHLIAQSPAQQKIIAEKQTSQSKADIAGVDVAKWNARQPVEQLATASQALSNAKTQADYTAIWNQLPAGIARQFDVPENWNAQSTPANAQRTGLTSEQRSAQDDRVAQLAKLTSAAELAQKAAKGDPDAQRALDILQKQSIAERQASNPNVTVNLTPGGQAIYDKSLLTTGQPVAIPRGPGGAQVISSLNRLGAAAPDTNLAANKADFKADSASLAKMQGQSDALDAYGAKFIGNLNQMKNIATEMPDSGSPYLNLPVRMLDQKLLGSDIYGRFNVARTIAANEGGRILSSGGNLGGVVSDNARNEISTLLDKNATLGQWMTAADQLNKDYGITKKAMSDQLTTIKGRIAAASNPAASAQAYAATATGANGHKVGTNDNGKTWFDVQTGKQVQ